MNQTTDVVISQNSIISLHTQLHNELRQLILSGRWPNATRIPSESEFVEHLKISRSTVRLALQHIEVEGLIERIAGRGTFVTYTAVQARAERIIAFVTCDFDSEHQLLTLNGIESEARAHGYQVSFSQATNHQEEIDILERLQEKHAGVILWSNILQAPLQNDNRYKQLRIPIVLVDRKMYGLDYDCVISDNYGGSRNLMQHFVELGHQHIVFLSHHIVELSSVKDRYRAYQDVLRENGLTPIDPWIIGPPGKEMSFKRALRSSVDNKSLELQTIKDYMLNAQPRPTAIFAINDLLAVLAMRAMKLLDLPLPDAVSIAGFDDIDLAAQLAVPLTTVAQDSFMIAKTAAQLLIERIEGNSGPTREQIIPTQLRIRNSTAALVTA